MTLSSIDGDHRTTLIEIFSWRDGSIPDAAPAAILAIWQELNGLVESRGGQPGLEVTNVTLLEPQAR